MITRYRTIVADPPWPVEWTSYPRRRRGGRWGAEKVRTVQPARGYSTMNVADIAGLPVGAMAAGDSHLFLWTFDQFLLDGSATLVARAWGFEPRRLLVWKKSRFGMGTFPRPQHEIVVVATRGKLPFTGPRNVGSVQEWASVYEVRGRSVAPKHSAKPDGFLDLIEQVSPGPYLELFARNARFGWDYWGDESLGTASLPEVA